MRTCLRVTLGLHGASVGIVKIALGDPPDLGLARQGYAVKSICVFMAWLRSLAIANASSALSNGKV